MLIVYIYTRPEKYRRVSSVPCQAGIQAQLLLSKFYIGCCSVSLFMLICWLRKVNTNEFPKMLTKKMQIPIPTTKPSAIL